MCALTAKSTKTYLNFHILYEFSVVSLPAFITTQYVWASWLQVSNFLWIFLHYLGFPSVPHFLCISLLLLTFREPPFQQVSAQTRRSFFVHHFCLIPPDSISVFTYSFKTLRVALFISGWVTLFGLSDLDFSLSHLSPTKMSFSCLLAAKLRQQPLLTPTGLIGLFHGYIRAMNFNDDGSHSVSDGLITHSHVTLRELVVQCVQVRFFPHFHPTLQ